MKASVLIIVTLNALTSIAGIACKVEAGDDGPSNRCRKTGEICYENQNCCSNNCRLDPETGNYCFSATGRTAEAEGKGNFFDYICDIWYENDPGPPKDIEHCPPKLRQVKSDSRFSKDTQSTLQYYHKGAVDSYRQSKPNTKGSGQQCVYDANESVMVGSPFGSSADWSTPINLGAQLLHILYDVVPWEVCCKRNKNQKSCIKYYNKRPSDDGSQYLPERS